MSSKIFKNGRNVSANPRAYLYPDLASLGGQPNSPAGAFFSATREERSDSAGAASAAELAAREQAGYERGLRDAEARFQEQLNLVSKQTTRALEKSLAEFAQLQRRVVEDSEKQVAKLALEIAKKIVRREVRIDEQIVLAMIKVALSYVSDARKVKVRVNPADLKSIRTHSAKSGDLQPDMPPPEFVADPAIERGGFVIESESGMVDGRLGQQFQEIEKSFFGFAQA